MDNNLVGQVFSMLYIFMMVIPLLCSSIAYFKWSYSPRNMANNVMSNVNNSDYNLKTKVIDIGILVQSVLTFIAFLAVKFMDLTFQSKAYLFIFVALCIIALPYILITVSDK